MDRCAVVLQAYRDYVKCAKVARNETIDEKTRAKAEREMDNIGLVRELYRRAVRENEGGEEWIISRYWQT